MSATEPEAVAHRAPIDAAAHQPMLRRYLFVLGVAAGELDDLVQDVFATALEKGVEERGAPATGTWLRRVARHLVLRRRASRAARREIEAADDTWEVAHRDLDHDDARVEALRRCLEHLPGQRRALLDRAYHDGAGRDELAHEFGLAVEGVKTALRRLRAALAACVERRLGGTR